MKNNKGNNIIDKGEIGAAKDTDRGKINFELLESYSPKDFILVKEPLKYPAAVPKEKFLYINSSKVILSGVFRRANLKKVSKKAFVNGIRVKFVSTSLAHYNPSGSSLYLINKDIERTRSGGTRGKREGRFSPERYRRFNYSYLIKAAVALVTLVAFLFTGMLFNRLFESNYDEGINIARQVIPCVVEVRVGGSHASGVIERERGGKTYILTNYHVIEGHLTDGEAIYVKPYGGNESEVVAVLGIAEKDKDLALIYINRTGLSVAKKAKNAVEYGQTVYAVGNALNGGTAITKGIVSHPRVRITMLGEESEKYYFINNDAIRFDAAISKGNSGGGLFNKKGELVGIVFGRPPEATEFGYAIPLSLVNSFLGTYFVL